MILEFLKKIGADDFTESSENVQLQIHNSLERRNVQGLHLFSIDDQLDLLACYFPDLIDDRLRESILTLTKQRYRRKSKKSGLNIKSTDAMFKIATDIVDAMKRIHPKLRFWIRHKVIVVMFEKGSIFRFEVSSHYRYRFFHGTIVVDGVNSPKEVVDQYPNILNNNRYTIGMRFSRRQGCIRNVTSALFVRIVRQWCINKGIVK